MRRLVAIPVKTLVLILILLAGGMYVAAEARQAMVRRQQQQFAEFERKLQTQPEINQLPEAQPSTALKQTQSDEVSAEQQAASLPAQKTPKPDGHTRQIVISIPDRQLALLEDDQVVKLYPIAVGATHTPSPDGEFEIINHAVDPVYRHKGKEIAPGKDNPLGTRWMGLSLKGYGIHGTNAPKSIGRAASHGCFRMGKADVEDLYSRVKVGDHITIRRERDAFIARIFTPDANVASAQVQVASASANPAAPAAEAGQ
jgi:lipoprotein-anchoring transpeptidase ErfK/SrfK